MTKTPERPEPTCPWCPYTAAGRTQVLRHLETVHRLRWLELALYPPIAGKVV